MRTQIRYCTRDLADELGEKILRHWTKGIGMNELAERIACDYGDGRSPSSVSNAINSYFYSEAESNKGQRKIASPELQAKCLARFRDRLGRDPIKIRRRKRMRVSRNGSRDGTPISALVRQLEEAETMYETAAANLAEAQETLRRRLSL